MPTEKQVEKQPGPWKAEKQAEKETAEKVQAETWKEIATDYNMRLQNTATMEKSVSAHAKKLAEIRYELDFIESKEGWGGFSKSCIIFTT